MTTDDLRREAVRLAARLEADIEHIQAAYDSHDDDAYDEAVDNLTDGVLSVDTRVTLDVTLYTGGPAGGVEFDVERVDDHWELIRARAWHQEWFTPRGHVDLDERLAAQLFDQWGLEYTS